MYTRERSFDALIEKISQSIVENCTLSVQVSDHSDTEMISIEEGQTNYNQLVHKALWTGNVSEKVCF